MSKIQVRRGIASLWTSQNPTLSSGEIGFETDTNQFKIGDGSTAWTALSYAGGGSGTDVTTKGDLQTFSTVGARLPIGSAGQKITPDPNETTGLKWINDTGGNIYTGLGVDVNVVSATNALTPITTPTSDGSGEAIHPSVVYFQTAWNSYHYWMAMTPYPDSDDQEENPEILASNDGITWVVPSPLVNPIQATPVGSTKHYSDATLVYNPDLDTLFCFYRYSETPTVEDRIYVQSSTNGTTWSSQTAIFSGGAFAEYLSPSFYYQDGVYTMMVIDFNTSPNNLNKATSTVAESGWSSLSTMTLTNLPAGRDLWQLEIKRFFNETHIFAVMTDVGTSGANLTLDFAKTIDDTNVTFAANPFIEPGASGNWDDTIIYTGTGIYNSTLGAYEFWYTGRDGPLTTDEWRTGYTILYLSATGATADQHTQGTDVTLGSGAVAADHGTAATDQIVNVSYGTSATPPTASTTTEGSLYIQYTA